MENLPTQFGALGLAIGAVVMIVRYFLAHLKDKDDKFTKVIENHINHSTITQEKLTNAIDKLSIKLKK